MYLFSRSELPENQYEQLKSEIIRYVITFCNGTRIVLTRLCIAVSLLLVVIYRGRSSLILQDEC